MEFIKRIFKREYLIPVFFSFAVLSLVVGIALLVYFISIFREYFLLAESGIEGAGSIQEVDFMGLTYGTIWTFIGIFFYFIALRLQIIDLKYQIKGFTEGKDLLRNEIFETEFLKLSKTQLELLNNAKYEYEGFNSISERRTILKVANGTEFFNFIRKLIQTLVNDMSVTYLKGTENETILAQQAKTLSGIGISASRFNTFIKEAKPVNKYEATIAVFDFMFSHFHRFLYPYFENLRQLYKLVDSAYDLEIMEGKENKDVIKEKYNTYNKFTKAHFSSAELSLVYYYSLSQGELKEILSKWEFFEFLSEEDSALA